MIPKFKLNKANGAILDVDGSKRREYLLTLPDGEYEVIIRPKIKWDVDKMRRFLHGPVIDFLITQFKQQGNVFTKPQLKEWIKREFGPAQASKDLTLSMPLSMSEWNFNSYRCVLQDINDWCADAFGCELPAADEVE